MLNQHSVYLFDVDGTLMTFHGAGRRAYEEALDDIVGHSNGLLDFSFAGLTDMGLVRMALERADEPATKQQINQVLDAYAKNLPDAIQTSEFTTHPGAHATLEFLHQFSNAAIGLGTGNIELGARLKLSYADPELNPFFDFGGFGSDAEQRDELLAAGARRGAESLGVSISDCRIVVIGDTPKDVHAGRAIGADVIGVTSGGASHAELKAADPDHLLTNLADPDLRHALHPK
jgi:phosphoglycolate phosphatase-like HAD superfamily hydrolase